LKIHKTINNLLGQAQDLGNIGYVYVRLGDCQKALGFLNEAKEIYSILGSVHEIQKVDTLIEEVKKHLNIY